MSIILIYVICAFQMYVSIQHILKGRQLLFPKEFIFL